MKKELELVPAEAREIFLWETSSSLSAMEQEFVLWNDVIEDRERIEKICQQLESLRRDFSFYSMKDPDALSEAMETALRRFLQGESFQAEFPEQAFLWGVETLRITMIRFAETGEVHIDSLKVLLEVLRDLSCREIDVFMLEADLSALEQEFVLWEVVALYPDRLNAICQHLDRLRANFVSYGMRDAVTLTQSMEETLQHFLQGELFQLESPEEVFLHALAALRISMNCFASTGKTDIENLNLLLDALHGLPRQRIGALLLKSGLISDEVLDSALLAQKADTSERPLRLGEILVRVGRVTKEQMISMLREQDNLRQQAKNAVKRIESLHNDEASEDDSEVLETVQEESVDALCISTCVRLLDQLSQEIDENSPGRETLKTLLSTVQDFCRIFFASLPALYRKTVEDMAVEHGKKIHFMIEGMQTLPNQYNLIAVADALLHLLSDLALYSLESPEKREAAGKSQQGKLIVLAVVQIKEICLIVKDDGQGINVKDIVGLMAQRGMISKEQAAGMDEREVLQMLLQSGKDLERRKERQRQNGSGLLDVLAALHRAKGKMNILPQAGQHTRYTLRIPRLV